MWKALSNGDLVGVAVDAGFRCPFRCRPDFTAHDVTEAVEIVLGL